MHYLIYLLNIFFFLYTVHVVLRLTCVCVQITTNNLYWQLHYDYIILYVATKHAPRTDGRLRV